MANITILFPSCWALGFLTRGLIISLPSLALSSVLVRLDHAGGRCAIHVEREACRSSRKEGWCFILAVYSISAMYPSQGLTGLSPGPFVLDADNSLLFNLDLEWDSAGFIQPGYSSEP